MKRLLLTTLILTAMTAPAFSHCGVCGVGEEKKPAMGKMLGKFKSKIDKMYDGLSLTEDQKSKLKVLEDTKNKAIQAAKDEFNTGFRALLTPEQLKIFEAMHKDHDHIGKISK